MVLPDNIDDPAAASHSSSSSRSNNTNKMTTWRDNVSKQKVDDHATKYYLQSSMPKDFVYTEEEKGLLQMYDTTKIFEREVMRLKEKKAREHIYAATSATAASSAGIDDDDDDDDNEQNANNNPAVAKKKKRKKKAAPGTAVPGMNDVDAMLSSSSEEDDDDDDEYDSDDDDNNNNRKKYSAEDKLKALRKEIEGKKLAKLQENDARATEERMRDELLAKNNDDMDGVSQPLLKRKKIHDDSGRSSSTLSPTTTRDGQGGGVPSLLSKMIPKQTPPHEFSEKLEFVPWKGKILFPISPDDEPKWTPALDYRPKNPNDGAFLVALEDFDITKAVNGEGPNTIAIKFQGPIDSKRFSFNIAGPNHNDFDSVLFHFNPRPREKGGLILVNDKQKGVWGRAVQLPLSEAPLMFGQSSATLIVQINGDGFDVFVENKHIARLEHRVELPSRPCNLFLQFPTCDDSRRPENWIVYKTWWGNKELMAKEDISNVAGVNAYDSVHPKKLFISGLKKLRTDQQIEMRTATMEREFGKYGGPRGVQTIVPKFSRYAFIEFETEQQCTVALQHLGSQYKLNRARRTKHEALTEERAEKESGKTKGW